MEGINRAILTPKQDLFCHEYLKDRNATQAYIRAGYSRKGARANAAREIAKDSIRAKINELLKEQLERLKIDSDMVIRGLLAIAMANVSDAFDEGNNLKPIKDMPEPTLRSIAFMKRVDQFDGQGKKRKKIGCNWCIRFYDRIRALELLGRHLKMFTDVHEIPGLENLAERMRAARKKIGDARRKEQQQKF